VILRFVLLEHICHIDIMAAADSRNINMPCLSARVVFQA